MKNFVYLIVAALLGAAIALGGSHLMGWNTPNRATGTTAGVPAQFTNFAATSPYASAIPDEGFTAAAERVLPTVVHIRASVRMRAGGGGMPFDLEDLPEPFRDFFGPRGFGEQGQPRERMQQGSGSGVILSSDGYIVTNNHVVQDAEELEVVLNDKRSFTAEVIGTDPSTDIALIKIDASELPAINFANSDDVRIGQWVVAVGNPFNLSSTVTAGIVSAKGRSINILEDQAPIEAFIQTDAVVNPGNSGGALVNIEGNLIGINTAIASPTGVFAGYAFAVPSDIVAKVVQDLKQYGVVQRAYLGAIIREVNGSFAKEMGLSVNRGVYIDSVLADGAAATAGLRKGDIVQRVDNVTINNSPELLEQIGRHRPGDKLQLGILRDGKPREVNVTLRNRAGNTDVVTREALRAKPLAMLGAEFEELTKEKAQEYGLRGGVQVTSLGNGALRQQTEIREGFIITAVDREPVETVAELEDKLKNKRGGVLIEGRYPQSSKTYYYGFGM